MKKRVLGAKGQRLIFMVSSAILALLAFAQVLVIFIFPTQKKSGITGDAVSINVSMLTPERIFITLGGAQNETYVCLEDEDEGMEEVSEHAAALIGCSLKDAVWVQADEQTMEWDRFCCVLIFSCMQSGSTLEQYYQTGSIPEFSFDQIYLYPSAKTKQDIKILFLNTEEQTLWQAFPGKRRSAADEQREWDENLALYEDLLEKGTDLYGVKYMEAGSHFEQYDIGTFITDTNTTQIIRKGELTVGFLADGQVSRALAETWVEGMFNSSGSVKRTDNESSVIFSNEKMTVKISDNGYLEYRETLTDAEKTETKLPEAYQTAVAFMKKEMELTGGELRTTLSSYSQQGGSLVFLFDYEVDGMKLVLNDKTDIMPEGGCPIRIVVTGNKVQEYQRLAVQSEMKEESWYIDRSWLDVTDQLAAMGQTVIGTPSLVYECRDGQMIPSWKVTVMDGEKVKIIFVPAE